MTNYAAMKQSLHKIYSLLDTVEGAGGKPSGINASLRDVFKVELHSYFLYLSATDGKVSVQESEFMNYLFDMHLTSQQYVTFINENNIFSTDFEQKVPVIFQILQAFDKKVALLSGITGNDVDPILPIVLKFYAEIGKAFITCDGADQSEVDEAQSYLNGILEKLMGRLENNSAPAQSGGDAVIGGKRGASVSRSEASVSRGTQYGPSVYKVGVDIPAGEYKVYPNGGRGYFAICTDANCDDIVRNENFNGQMYININHGQFLELVRCYAVPVAEAPKYNANSGVYGDGEYKVGVEIPAGEYRVIAEAGQRGYYAIEKPKYNGDRDIISNNNFTNAAYVSVQNGQILNLTRCSIRV